MVNIGKIIAYECGELSDDDTVAMFQELINDGSAWTLQGCYGRMAMRLIEAGLCHHEKPAVPPKPRRVYSHVNGGKKHV
jgi:hypothetical protein